MGGEIKLFLPGPAQAERDAAPRALAPQEVREGMQAGAVHRRMFGPPPIGELQVELHSIDRLEGVGGIEEYLKGNMRIILNQVSHLYQEKLHR